MDSKTVKCELQNILQGKDSVSHGELIQIITHYLRKSTLTSTVAEKKRAEQTKRNSGINKIYLENNGFIN